MEKEKSKIKSSTRKDNGIADASLLTFDLPSLVEKMKHKHTRSKGELNAMILLKSPDKQIVLTALHEGTEIKSSPSNDSITFHIIEGKMKFQTKKESVNLEKGQLLTLHENIKYCLTIKEETVLLLTFANVNMKAKKIDTAGISKI